MSTIKFERVLRDCEANRRIQAETADGRGLIYDFKVLIDGEHRATMVKRAAGTGYVVYDPDHQPIVGAQLNHGRTTRYAGKTVELVGKQAHFERIISLLLEEDKIPTLEQMVAARAERERADAEIVAASAEQARINKIEAAGVDLYEALKSAMFLLEAANGRCTNDTVLILNCRKAIAKAEGRD